MGIKDIINNEKLVVSSGIQTRVFEYLNCRFTYSDVEKTVIGSESYSI